MTTDFDVETKLKIQVPRPDCNISCQNLRMRGSFARAGYLRRKKPGILGAFASFISQISWDKYYVMLSNGCLYLYKSEQQLKPEKAFSLFGFTQVCRAGELRVQKDTQCTFKLVYMLDEKGKVHYFCATSEAEMKDWMKELKKQMIIANCIYPKSSSGDDDNNSFSDESEYSDLETPISTVSYFRGIQNMDDIQRELGDDDDYDENYEEIQDVGKRQFSPPVASPESFTVRSNKDRTQSGGGEARAGGTISGEFQRSEAGRLSNINRPLPQPPPFIADEYYDDGVSVNDRVTYDNTSPLQSPKQPTPPPPLLPKKPMPQPPTQAKSRSALPSSNNPALQLPASAKTSHKPTEHQEKQLAKSKPVPSSAVGAGAVSPGDGAQLTDTQELVSRLASAAVAQGNRLKPVAERTGVVTRSSTSITNQATPVLGERPGIVARSSTSVLNQGTHSGSGMQPWAVSANTPQSVSLARSGHIKTQSPPEAETATQRPTKVAILPPSRSAGVVNPTGEPNTPVTSPSGANAPDTSHTGPTHKNVPKVPKKPSVVAGGEYLSTNLEAAAFYDGEPGEASILLVSKDYEGAYMIRASGSAAASEQRVDKDKFSLQSGFQQSFSSINEMLRHYSLNSLPNRPSKLSKPYSVIR